MLSFPSSAKADDKIEKIKNIFKKQSFIIKKNTTKWLTCTVYNLNFFCTFFYKKNNDKSPNNQRKVGEKPK